MEKQNNGLTLALSLAGKHKPGLIIAIFLAIAAQICGLIPYCMIYQILKMLIAREMTSADLGLLVAGAVVAAIGRIALGNGARVLSHTAAYNTLHDLRVTVLRRLSRLHSGFFDTHSTGHLKTAIFDDVGRLENILAHGLLEMVQAVVVPILLLAGLLVLNPLMGVLLMIPVILGIGIPMIILNRYPVMMEEFTRKYRAVNASATEFITTMPVIKMYQLTVEKFETHARALRAYLDCFKTVSSLACRMLSISVVVLDSAVAFAVPVGGVLFFNGGIDLATYLLMLLLSIAFYSSFASVMNIMMGMKEMDIGLDSIREIRDTTPIRYGDGSVDTAGGVALEYKHVGFSYDGVTAALTDLSFEILPGTVTAFVGGSGSGKTTAAQLLGRYYEPQEGTVRVNGIDIGKLDRETVRNLTAFVFQDAFIMNDTIHANLCMGKDHPRQAVAAAATAANIHGFIEGLPNGYDTVIGGGEIKLSGGQKQRIAIARAVLKNAPVVVFDEATSYTDIENEYRIQQALSNLLAGRTTIMIAHRLHTIINVDQILVFDNGRVVEKGTHGALLANNGHYKALWDTYVSARRFTGETEAA